MTTNRFADGWFYHTGDRRSWSRLRANLKGAYLRALRENEPQYLLAGLHLWKTVAYAHYDGDYSDLNVICEMLSLSNDTIRDWLERFREGDAIEVQVRTEHGMIVYFNLAKIQ